MTTTEDLRLEIDKQLAAGFTVDEIRSNLKAKQFSSQDIESAMKQQNVAAKAKSSAGIGIVSVLVSVYFIFTGIMRMSKYPSGSGLYIFGVVMLCVGVGGLIFKLYELAKRG